MSIPVLSFFNNKGGVGKTSLIYHVAWMLAETGHRVLACDLDPQANLTSAFLDETRLEKIWGDGVQQDTGITVFQCVKPLLEVGDLKSPVLYEVTESLKLIPGDLALSGFEDTLSEQWPKAMGSDNLYRPFRILTAFWELAQQGAKMMDANVVLIDIGPNLGAINRSALIATDFVIIPLSADLFSLQGLRNLGPTLKRWRIDWKKRYENWQPSDFLLPKGNMKPLGYVVQQHSVRQDRPVQAYRKWIRKMPDEYARNMTDTDIANNYVEPEDDPACLATLKHFRSLVPMAQECRKPIFSLTYADGAIGSHAQAAADAGQAFQALSEAIVNKAGLA